MAEGGRMLHFARGRGQCGITITQVRANLTMKIPILKHIVNITIVIILVDLILLRGPL